MQSAFRGSTAGWVLTLVSACVISANVEARSATARASASVTAPVTIGGTLQVVSTSAFVSGTTGDLIIRLPGAGPSGVDGGPRPSETSISVAVVTEGCIKATGSLADCIMARTDDGMLVGDPVSGLGFKAVEGGPSGTANVSITVLYN
ncbi:hypothetical protein MKP05_15700 [Halomonas sp. EGI 63088]|uniref:DUF4402 domain-containing protein n=1 Tax=Halomonas flagellata TaxID=2920385 RepID=A0ABS9RXH8_9GAMM|nr:hypothetical protein [Halomonas flagellata]MCH4564547.1 hypothetical protein [Halomonas flagellata]